jgi:PleD family two-component response regulator
MKKVLVVEDDQFLANAYKLKLSNSDFDVKVASDGKEALSIMEEFLPDVVLLDLIMPNMDGFETLQVMKASDKLKSVPVIVASNLGQKEDFDKATALGASDFIIKSNVSIEDIITKVNKLIS